MQYVYINMNYIYIRFNFAKRENVYIKKIYIYLCIKRKYIENFHKTMPFHIPFKEHK